MKNSYGNYVIQKALKLSNGHFKVKFTNNIQLVSFMSLFLTHPNFWVIIFKTLNIICNFIRQKNDFNLKLDSDINGAKSIIRKQQFELSWCVDIWLLDGWATYIRRNVTNHLDDGPAADNRTTCVLDSDPSSSGRFSLSN